MADADPGGGAASKGQKKGRLSVERIYQKKSQLEHILLRPDTYIGSVQPLTEKMYVLDEESQQIVNRKITYVPVFTKYLTRSSSMLLTTNNKYCKYGKPPISRGSVTKDNPE